MKLLFYIFILTVAERLDPTRAVEVNSIPKVSVQEIMDAFTQSEIQGLVSQLHDFQKDYNNQYNLLLKNMNMINKNILTLQKQTMKILIKVNPKNFDEVVNMAYDSNPEVFEEKLISFDKSVQSRNRTLILYQELSKLGKGAIDVGKFINMMMNIGRYYDDPNWPKFKEDALRIIKLNIKDEIAARTSELNSTLCNLRMNSVLELDEATGFDLMVDIVFGTKFKVPYYALSEFVHAHENLSLRVHGYAAILRRLVEDYDYDGLFSLALKCKDTKSKMNIDEKTKMQLEKLIASFPPCIKNAAFAPKVCIKNKLTGNYLKLSNKKNIQYLPLLSPGENDEDTTKWRFKTVKGSQYVMLQNIGINSYVKKISDAFISYQEPNIDKVVDGTWYIHPSGVNTCSLFDHTSAHRSYLGDSEGTLTFFDDKNNLCNWLIEAC